MASAGSGPVRAVWATATVFFAAYLSAVVVAAGSRGPLGPVAVANVLTGVVLAVGGVALGVVLGRSTLFAAAPVVAVALIGSSRSSWPLATPELSVGPWCSRPCRPWATNPPTSPRPSLAAPWLAGRTRDGHCARRHGPDSARQLRTGRHGSWLSRPIASQPSHRACPLSGGRHLGTLGWSVPVGCSCSHWCPSRSTWPRRTSGIGTARALVNAQASLASRGGGGRRRRRPGWLQGHRLSGPGRRSGKRAVRRHRRVRARPIRPAW